MCLVCCYQYHQSFHCLHNCLPVLPVKGGFAGSVCVTVAVTVTALSISIELKITQHFFFLQLIYSLAFLLLLFFNLGLKIVKAAISAVMCVWRSVFEKRNCRLTSTEAIRDEWEKGERRVKPRNRCKPRRPRLPRTAARTIKCYGSVRSALCSNYRTTQLLSQLLCRTESQRPGLYCSSAVGKQLKQKKSSSLAQLHLPALDLFWANFWVQHHLPSLDLAWTRKSICLPFCVYVMWHQ